MLLKYKVKTKLCPCLIMHHNTIYEEVEVTLHALLTLTLDAVERVVLHPGCVTSGGRGSVTVWVTQL
jgi:hypothetical protein